jgi:hypothetical protein
MNANLAGEPYAIHVGVDDELLARFDGNAHAAGMSVIRVDLSGVSDRATLADHLAEAFMIPHETRGLDAAVDLISDLEWFGNSSGYLVVVDGLDRATGTAEAFASLLPNIVDRWRSQALPFIVAICGSSDLLTSTLAAANHAMDEAGSLPWAQPGTGAVEVVVHDSHPPGVDL